MSTYSTRDVVRLTKLSAQQVRQLVRQGWVSPARDKRGSLRFDFAMIGRLKRAQQLISEVRPRKLGAALRRLDKQPDLDQLVVIGGELVVRGDSGMWEARTGQVPMDFDDPEYSVISVFPAPTPVPGDIEEYDAEDWFELACDRDGFDDAGAREAYGKALELDPDHVEAKVGLAGLLETGGDAFGAIDLLRSAIESDGGHAVAWQLLGVCLEQVGREDEALEALENSLEADPWVAEVHELIIRICDALGLKDKARQHREELAELQE